MSAPAYPRVLFLTSAAFNRATGGGITFSNLFAGWPKDRLGTAHNDPIPTTSETCDRYYRLGPREIRRSGPLERIAPAAGDGNGGGQTAGASRRKSLLRPLKHVVFGDQLPDTGTLSADLERWIEEFRPELLYTILGTNAMMELVDAIERRFRVPLVLHMMDDWPASSYRGGALGFLARRKMERLVRGLIGRAAARLAICDEMKVAYEARYGAPFIAFQNAVDTARWGPLAKRQLAPGTPADVVYVGSVLPVAQLGTLIDCCTAAAALAGEGLEVRLSIYSPSVYAERFRDRLVIAPNISLHDTITEDEAFFRRLARADALLLPVNFDAAAVALLRYSMPTKVPAYLVSGTPILACGPDAVAQIRYARDAGWAHVVSEPGAQAIARGMRAVLEDAALRTRLSDAARRVARERHDAAAVRGGFQAALRAAALR